LDLGSPGREVLLAVNNANNSWNLLAGMTALEGSNSVPSNLSLYGSLLSVGSTSGLSTGLIPITPKPDQPAKTNYSQLQEAIARFEKRVDKLRNVLPVKVGRVVPSDDVLPIGDARRMPLTVLFLDICKFSQIPNESDEQQDNVLKLLNLFMAEMLQVVKMHNGEFEKNTGDGLMAYFKESSQPESAKRAVEAAVTMHSYNDYVISPRLAGMGLPQVKFRVGIEAGLVTIANVGVYGGDHRSLVAIGTTANVACKMMSLMKEGGIVIGNYTQSLLPDDWKRETKQIGAVPGFVASGSGAAYPAWELTYRAPNPLYWASLGALGLMGRL
jgi:adenylate cyclase